MGNFNWQWDEFCETGRNISSNTSVIAPCYQQLHIQLPTYAWLAIFSSYHYGLLSNGIYRNQTQIICLNLRALIVLGLAVTPVIQLLKTINVMTIWPVDILLTLVQFLAWTIHLCESRNNSYVRQILTVPLSGLVTSYKRFGGLSHRGPLILLVLWSGSISSSMLWFQTSLERGYWPYSLTQMILNIFYGLTLIPNGKSERIPREVEQDRTQVNTYHRLSVDGDEESFNLGASDDGANFISRILFRWVNPLIAKGAHGKLRSNEDLFDLPESLNVKKLFDKLQKNIDASKSLFKALHRSFGWQFYSIGILRLISDMSNFAGPLLLGGLLRSGGNEEAAENDAFYYAAGLFLTTLLSAIAGVQFNWKISMVSMKMRSSLVSAIYAKGLEAKGLNDAKPEILNLMSTDTDRIVNSCVSFHSFWSIPFQLVTALYLLYTQLGVAFVSGIMFAVLLIPINRYIAKQIGKLSSFLMSAKDGRVQLTTEALVGAKQIKLQALENVFTERISELRKSEIKFLSKRKYLDAWCVYFWATTPVLINLLTFGGLVLMGMKLTAAATYTSVALLNLLISPLNSFPWILNGLMESSVSLRRVQELISLDNINLSGYYSPVVSNYSTKSNESPVVLSVKNASFSFNHERDRTGENLNVNDITDFTLENVNLEVHRGQLVCIEGTVGSGKTSLLNAILGNLKRTSGAVCMTDNNVGFGYVSQVPWLQRGTIRENICWGCAFDEGRYQTVINCCALREDIEKLGGDNVGVGEGGRTLSGGQKARITLARALYQEKQIYIFDDILSALDAHVAAYIVKFCIFGFLSKKTRIIVTQNKSLLQRANQIIHINNGEVTTIEQMNDDDDYLTDEELEITPRRASTPIEPDRQSIDSCLMEETKERGQLSSSVIGCYWKATGRVLGSLVLLSVVLMQASRNLTDAWLAHWVSIGDKNGTNLTAFSVDSNFYLETYTSLALGNSILTLLRSFLFAYAGIKAAKKVHEKLLKSVFETKLQFFDVTPLGRILNRFSSDTYTIDDTLPFILNILLAQLFGLLGSISISLYALPWLGLIIAPLCPIYLDIQSKYRNASRDVKRLSSNALSPLYAQFTETLQGLTTIRAMRASRRFQQDFAIKLEQSIKAQLTSSAASCWLAIRLQFLGAIIVGGAGILTALTSAHTSAPGMVGLAISYALSISGLLSGVLNAFSETEQEMIAVERVGQYLKLPKESNVDGTADPPFSWPHQGVIKFKDVHMSYRENLVPALNGISFNTAAYERVGIVGRTGAGKSSIINALLRVSETTRGQIMIDNVDINTLPLNVLRNRVAIVPQEPFLFSGTVRDNLDPRSLHLDSEIWNAITHCLTSPLVQGLGGLSGKIESGGSNLSAGQKQLLCLTRALLKSAKVSI